MALLRRLEGLVTMECSTRVEADEKACDRMALLMMLAYVEAECRRLGNEAAARHAAMAAALVPRAGAPSGARLH
jgi:hypothetical protein